MSIMTKVSCDYTGYCGRKVDMIEAIKEHWAQIEVTGNILRISEFDGTKPNALIACEYHVDEVARNAVYKMDWCAPKSAPEVQAVTPVPESDIPY